MLLMVLHTMIIFHTSRQSIMQSMEAISYLNRNDSNGHRGQSHASPLLSPSESLWSTLCTKGHFISWINNAICVYVKLIWNFGLDMNGPLSQTSACPSPSVSFETGC
eukprot:639861_1